MVFPSKAQLLTHLLVDIRGDGTEAMSDWMDGVGAALNAAAGGSTGQALVKNSNVDYDLGFVDLAFLSDDFPQPDGAAAPGVSIEASRADHVHASVGAGGGVGLVQAYQSTSDGVTFSSVAPGLNLIDINPSPTLLVGHHYLWVFSGEWTDINISGETSMNFLDASNNPLARRVTNAINTRRSGLGMHLEDGAGVTVHRKLNVLSAAVNSGVTKGAAVPYRVLLLDLGNQ